MSTRSASATHASRFGRVERPDLAAARRRTSESESNPATSLPARRAAIAIEVPIRPVPTTATRSGEVISEGLGPVQVDMIDLAGGPFRVEEHQDPDDLRHGAF